MASFSSETANRRNKGQSALRKELSERAAALRAAFRPCREVTVDAGVFVANENPAAFARAVLDYLADAG